MLKGRTYHIRVNALGRPVGPSATSLSLFGFGMPLGCQTLFLSCIADPLTCFRFFAPPDGYDPGKASLPQFALVITNRTFESPKIPDIPEQVGGRGVRILQRRRTRALLYDAFLNRSRFRARHVMLARLRRLHIIMIVWCVSGERRNLYSPTTNHI